MTGRRLVVTRCAPRRAGRTLLAVSVAALLAACGNDLPLLDRDPGVYDGPRDPLIEESAAARAEALAERFELIQAPPGRTTGDDANAQE